MRLRGSKLSIDYGVKAHSRMEYWQCSRCVDGERGRRIMVRIHFNQLILRDVEDGYPLGLISLDRQFESGSRY